MLPQRLHPLNSRKPSKQNRRRLRFETLEAKRLLAGDVIFADSFEQGSNSNDWNGAWVENSGGDDWFRSTQRATEGSYSAEIDQSGSGIGTLTAAVDLSSYADAQLSFSWYIEGSFGGNDYLAVEVSADGNNWTRLKTLAGNGADSEGVWHDEQLAIPNGFRSADFEFRFVGNVNKKQKDGNVDNVQLMGTPLAPTTPTISVSDASVTEGDSGVIQLTTVASTGNGGWALRPSPDYDADGFADQYVSVRILTNNILRFDPQNASEPEVFIPEGHGGMVEPRVARFGPDGNLYVVDYASDKILRFDGVTGDPLGIDPASPNDATFVHETSSDFLAFSDGLVFDAADDLLVSAAMSVDGIVRSQIVRYQGPLGATPGAILDIHIPWATGDFQNAKGLELDSQGNLFVTNLGLVNEGYLSTVKRFDSSGLPYPANGQSGADFVPSNSAGLAGAYNLRIANPDGAGPDLFVPSENGILRFDGSTGVFKETYITPPSQAYDIEFLGDGTSLVARGEILRFGPAASAVFTVSLSSPTVDPVTVDISTVDGTATGGSDFRELSTSLVFQPGETTKQVVVPTYDDSELEPVENYSVQLTNIVGADPGDTSGTGTITDNETAPTFSIDDVSVVEGDSGTTIASFTVTRSGDTNVAVSVDYETQDGSATTPADYVDLALSTLNFGIGETTKTVDVTVKGDELEEGDEEFYVNLSSPSAGASITKAQGVGTIQDDDAPAAPTMYVADLDATSTPASRGKWDATVTVSVVDSNGDAVVGATVNFVWSNGASGSATTDGSGMAVIELPNINKKTSSVTFTITSLVKSGFTYNEDDNTDPDGDSDGTAITADKP